MKNEINFSRKVKGVVGEMSDSNVLFLLVELKAAGFEAQSLIRFAEDLKKVRKKGESLDRILASAGVLLDLYSRGVCL
ncbi:MAG: hypothetical protein M1290_01820 [Candidatus Thermoplasmatota archaeon]|jgi:hypothetical protein|nr:hypothetical protein [Candidatus Thermoplasmatota archaeon]